MAILKEEENRKKLEQESKPKNQTKPQDSNNDKNVSKYTKSIQLGKIALEGFRKTMSATLSVMKKAGSVFASIGKSIGGYLLGNIRKLISAINMIKGRIGTILLRRAITSMLRGIYAGMQEGIQNMYKFSEVARTSFVGAMDQMATASQYLKNSLGAMLAPAIEALAPVVDFIIDKFVALINTINQVISILTGKGFWTKAIKAPKSYGDAISDSANKAGNAAKKAADELKLWLAPWDELHLTPVPDKDKGSGGSGSGGGSGNDDDASLMFENVPLDSTLKDLIESGDWYGVGALFAEKLNMITAKADEWLVNTFEPWAIQFGTNLGNLINGFVDKYDWELLGKTIADGMMALVRGANSFLETTDWLGIGTAIGTSIMGWFNNISWDEIGTYFAEKFNALILTVEGLVTTVFGSEANRNKIADSIKNVISTWFDTVKWEDLGNALIVGFNGAVDILEKTVSDTKFWNDIKLNLKPLWDKLGELDANGLGKSLSTLFTKGFTLVDWETIGTKIGEFLGGIDWGNVTITILNAAWDLIKGAISGFFNGEHGGELVGLILTALAAKIALENLTLNLAMTLGLGTVTNNITQAGIVSALGTGGNSLSGMLINALASALGVSASAITLGALGVITVTLFFAYMFSHKPDNDVIDNGDGTYTTINSETGMVSHNNPDGSISGNVPGTTTIQTVYPDGTVTYEDARDKGREQSREIAIQLALKKPTNVEKVIAETQVDVNSKPVTKKVDAVENKPSVPTALTNVQYEIDKGKKLTALVNSQAEGKAATNAVMGAMQGNVKKSNGGYGLWSYITPWAVGQGAINGVMRDEQGKVKKSNGGWALWSYITPWASSQAAVNSAMKNMQTKINNYGTLSVSVGLVSGAMPNTTWKKQNKANGGIFANGKWKDITAYASGGYPDGSQLFWARENGPELVGTIGNHTAVVNNDQIVASVSDGVARAVASVMGGNNGNQSITVYLDGEVVYKNVVRRNNQQIARTGNSELFY